MNKNSKLILAAVALLIGGKKVIDLKNASENEKKFAPVIRQAEVQFNIPQGLLHRLIKQESHFRTDIITGQTVSPTGAKGIAQFMPATAKQYGVNVLDPVSSINGAARYLVALKRLTGTWERAVASYNWGPGNVLKAVTKRGADYLAIAPTETRNYVKNVYEA